MDRRSSERCSTLLDSSSVIRLFLQSAALPFINMVHLGGVKSDEHGFFPHQSKVDTEVFSLALSNGVGRMSARIFVANLACSPIYENSVFRVELGEGWS